MLRTTILTGDRQEDNDMDTAMQHLQKAYTQLSLISVRGDDADRMAIARQELRSAFAELEQMSRDVKKGEADGSAD